MTNIVSAVDAETSSGHSDQVIGVFPMICSEWPEPVRCGTQLLSYGFVGLERQRRLNVELSGVRTSLWTAADGTAVPEPEVTGLDRHCFAGFVGRDKVNFVADVSSGIGRRSDFPELAAAGEVAFQVCVHTIADCHTGKDALPPRDLQNSALVLWSMVHGLSNLLIDRHVDLAGHGAGSSRETLRAILIASDIQHKTADQS